MAYDSTTGKITAAVSIDDLKRCFGVVIEKVSDTNAKGVSCDLGVIIGKSVGDTFTDVNGVQWRVKSRREINMWAKFKPVSSALPFNNVNTIVSSQYNSTTGKWKTSASQQWWRDTQDYTNSDLVLQSTKYGLYVKKTNSVKSLYNLYNLFGGEWVYAKPTGGSTSPYRMTDFVEYNHNATDQSAKVTASSTVVIQTSNNGIWSIDVARLMIEDDTALANRDYLKQEDALGFTNVYFGFAVCYKSPLPSGKSVGDPVFFTTGTHYEGVSDQQLKKGYSYYIVPFWSDVKLGQDTGAQGSIGTIATVHGARLLELSVAGTAVTTIKYRVIITGSVRNGIARATIKFQSGTYNQVTYTGGSVTNIVVYFCRQGFTPSTSSIIEVGDVYARTTIDDFSLPSNSEATYNLNANVDGKTTVHVWADGMRQKSADLVVTSEDSTIIVG